MTTRLQRSQLRRIADDVSRITTDFEEFGRVLMDHFTPVRLTHPGLNESGFPVGYTVDTVSSDGRFVAQYSAERNYFTRAMPKAVKDLNGVLLREPDAKLIYLLSSNRKQNAPFKKFRSAAGADPRMRGRQLFVWGALEIAQIAREFLFNDLAIEELGRFLPELRRIREEEAATLEVQSPDPDHVAIVGVAKEIDRRLKTSRFVVLAGVPGIGKSAAARDYAARHKARYDLCIWADAAKLTSAKALNALPITRGGEDRNVAYLLKTQPTLLVLDDLQTGFDLRTLGDLCGAKSRIIVTRRRGDPDDYVLPFVDREIARLILDRDVDENCPDDVFATIWGVIRGHPLTLSLINADVRNETPWSDIVRDCEKVGAFEHEGKLLTDYLLERIRPVVANELSVFRWAGQARCDRHFLEALVMPLGIRKLDRNMLTAADRAGSVRLHEIIFAVLQDEPVDPARDAELDRQLEGYLERAARQNTLDFWNAARSLRPKLEALVRAGQKRPAYLYALLQIWTLGQFDPGLLPDPAASASQLDAGASPIAIAAIIETIERGFLHDRRTLGQVAAGKRLESLLPVFDTLAGIEGLDQIQRSQIEHHRGKALSRANRKPEAIQLFEALLSRTHNIPETKLQLIRLYRAAPDQAGRVKGWMRELLDGRREGVVSRSLALAVMEELPWGDAGWRRNLISEHEERIERTIIAAASAGMPQAYGTLASVGRYWARHDPAPLQRVFRNIPPRSLEGDLDDADRGTYAELLMALASLEGESREGRLREAEMFFEAIEVPGPYQLQRHAELLLDMNRAEAAEGRLEEHPELNTAPFVKRLMARAKRDRGDPRSALGWIDEALADLQVERFRSEFLELRYRIRADLGDAAAVDDLRSGLAIAAAGRERDRLMVELERVGSAASSE